MVNGKNMTGEDVMAIHSLLKFIHDNNIKNYPSLIAETLKEDSEKKQDAANLFPNTLKYREFLVDYYSAIEQAKANNQLKDINKKLSAIDGSLMSIDSSLNN